MGFVSLHTRGVQPVPSLNVWGGNLGGGLASYFLCESGISGREVVGTREMK